MYLNLFLLIDAEIRYRLLQNLFEMRIKMLKMISSNYKNWFRSGLASDFYVIFALKVESEFNSRLICAQKVPKERAINIFKVYFRNMRTYEVLCIHLCAVNCNRFLWVKEKSLRIDDSREKVKVDKQYEKAFDGVLETLVKVSNCNCMDK